MRIFNSIFDTQTTKTHKLWQKVTKDFEKTNRVTFQAYAAKNSRAEQQLDIRFFYIQDHFLCYKKNQNSRKTKAALDLRFTRIQCQKLTPSEGSLLEDFYCALIFSKNNSYTRIFISCEEDLCIWREVLNKLVVNCDIHEKYCAYLDPSGSLDEDIQISNVVEKQTGYSYSVKKFKKSKNLNSEIQKTRLKKEIENLRNLNHNYLIQLSEVQETKSSLYLIYESIKGKSVLSREHKAENLDQIASVFFKLLTALEYLKERNLVVLNISPESIKFKYDHGLAKINKPVITDLSLMADTDPLNQDSMFKVRQVRKIEDLVFTAPEILEENIEENMLHMLNSKLDVYSLGAILALTLAEYANKSIFYEADGKSLNLDFKRRIDFQKLKDIQVAKQGEEEAQQFGLLVDLALHMTQHSQASRASIEECIGHKAFSDSVKRIGKMNEMANEDSDLEENSGEEFFDYLFSLDNDEMELRDGEGPVNC